MRSENELIRIAQQDSIRQIPVMSETSAVTVGLVLAIFLAIPLAIIPPLALVAGIGGWVLGTKICDRIRESQYKEREEYFQRALRSLKYEDKLPSDL